MTTPTLDEIRDQIEAVAAELDILAAMLQAAAELEHRPRVVRA